MENPLGTKQVRPTLLEEFAQPIVQLGHVARALELNANAAHTVIVLVVEMVAILLGSRVVVVVGMMVMVVVLMVLFAVGSAHKLLAVRRAVLIMLVAVLVMMIVMVMVLVAVSTSVLDITTRVKVLSLNITVQQCNWRQ